jgi:hypothetical protein
MEAKHFFKNNIHKYRMRKGRESLELELNHLARKLKILQFESIISYQIQQQKKKQPQN